MSRTGGKRGWVALVLAVAMTLSTAAVALADEDEGEREDGRAGFELGPRLRDLDEAPWASKFVTTAQMQGVIRGYPGGFFGPNRAVSRQESLCMVTRALGLTGTAQGGGSVGGSVYGGTGGGSVSGSVYGSVYGAVYLPFTDAAAVGPWAVPCVQAALDKGLIQGGGVLQPHRAASRLWVVTVLVKAMGLDAQARQRAGEQLGFNDEAAIPAELRGYVAVAMDAGLVAGFPNGTFRPHQPVTRAEMAKMLDVMQGQQNPQPQQFVVTGVVYATGQDSVTVRSAGGQQTTYALAAGALVFVDNQPATLADVQPGFAVRLYLSAQGQAVLVDARTAAAPPRKRPDPFAKREVKGTVTAVDAAALAITVDDRRFGEETYQVAEWAEIELDGVGYGTLADVQPGDVVDMKVRGDVVVKIEVKSEEDGFRHRERLNGEVRGEVDAVGDGELAVQLADGTTVTLAVAASVEVKIEGYGQATLGDVQPGDWVKVKVRQGQAVKIEVKGGRTGTLQGGPGDGSQGLSDGQGWSDGQGERKGEKKRGDEEED